MVDCWYEECTCNVRFNLIFIRKEEKQLWKLSSTENSSRMRLKLVKLFNGTDHQDASRLRDQDTLEVVTSNEIMDLNIPTAKEEEDSIQDLVLSGEEDQDEVDAETGQEKHMYDLNPLNESVGRVITSFNCHLITLMDVIPGKIELTSHISFYDDSNDSLVGCDFQFSLEKLQEMHMRRYNLRKTGLEFFLVDRSSYLINFRDHEERNTFFKKTTGRRPPNLYYNGIKSPQRLLRESNLTQRWVKREITNFDYLMQLNTIAGRTYNDLAQYPVFPWVLADYESKELDLENPAVFRDLSRPIGALVADRLEALEIRYRELFDPSGFQHQCHYLTHYSNAAIVLHYLLRVEPFTSLHVKLQGGKFDCSDRQFYSVAKSWRGLINSAGDVRELIPEFFCFPDFLSNVNKLDLGYLQNGQSIDDVVLPPWASSPDDFIHKNRMALESEYVSMNLHHWIDLIFGYKQKGEEAVKAYNVFHHYSYEGAIDLDAIDNPKERTAIEGIINNFGQTPCQLLTKPHPIRKSISEIKQQTNILDNLTKANYSLVKVKANGPPLTFIGARKTRQKSLLHHGMPDPLITVDKNGFIGFHGWMPFPEDKTESFSFSLDPNLNQKMNRTKNPTNKIPGIWSPQVSRTSQLFALTPDGKLLICCGFWDNSLRVLNSKGKILNVIYQHLDIVSCVSLDPSDHYFISGSYDSSCMVWKIQHHAGSATGILEQPLQTLHGHDDAVNTVAMVWELDMAVSGSKDGSCIIHTIKKGQFVMTLRPDPLLLDSSISKVCLTKYGRIVMYSTHNYKDETDHMLTVYTINGTLVSKVSLHEAILDVIVVKDIIISGGIRGTLTARDVYRLESPLIAKNLQYPIHCISVTPDASHIFACIEDGNIIVLGP